MLKALFISGDLIGRNYRFRLAGLNIFRRTYFAFKGLIHCLA